MIKLSCFAAVAAAWTGAVSAAPAPASAFARLPVVWDAAITAGGSKIAVIGGDGDKRVVTLSQIDGAQATVIGFDKADVEFVQWAGEDHLVVTANVRDGDNLLERQFVVGPDGKVDHELLGKSAASQFVLHRTIRLVTDGPDPVAFVVGVDFNTVRAEDTRLGVEANDFRPALWRTDVKTGASQVVERGDFDTYDWLVDRTGESRVRFDGNSQRHTAAVRVRAKGAKSWSTLVSTTDSRARPLPTLLGYSDAADSVYLAEGPSDALQVVRHKLVDGTTSVVAAEGAAHGLDVTFDRYTDELVAITTTEAETVARWLDPKLEAISAKLRRAFPGATADLYDWSRDRGRMLVKVESQDAPARWYLLETAGGQLSPVASAYPELEGARLGTTKWITYKARDGLEIPAYLTLPPGAADRGALPLIVLPHGGATRNSASSFDWTVQLLATRGYAVLRPQFRGSTGFGAVFEKADEGEWGDKVQTDLLDGVADLAAKGIVDPARVCIVGFGMGGYLALSGAAFHPESYKCAISVDGVSDVTSFVGQDTSRAVWWSGVSGAKSGSFAAVSPASRASDVRAPILLIASERETGFLPAQSKTMKQALDAARKPSQLLTLVGDDGNYSTATTRTRLLEATEAFLAENLPVTP